MSRRRRATLLLGLALVLGALAASDVARREAALRAELAPLVDVVVARRDLGAGHRLAPEDLARRAVPERFAPAAARDVPPELLNARRLAVPVAAGDPVGPRRPPPPARAGRRGGGPRPRARGPGRRAAPAGPRRPCPPAAPGAR